MKKLALLSLSLLAVSCSTIGNIGASAEQVRSADIYVTPYYSAQHGKPLVVNVYPEINQLLMNNNQADWKKAEKIVLDEPELVTPMTMFALSARAYDLGLRDESVFWFYNGKYRLMTVSDVLNLPKTTMAEYGAFHKLVSQFVLPYAFCDTNKAQATMDKSLAWVKAHPYQALFVEKLPAKQKDRKSALAKSEQELTAYVKKSQDYINTNNAELQAQRKANGTDVKFCWK